MGCDYMGGHNIELGEEDKKLATVKDCEGTMTKSYFEIKGVMVCNVSDSH